jgi:predicted nucleic acid-binding protein
LVFARGIAAQLRVEWQAGRCVPRASKATVQELVRVLPYPKFRLDAAVQQELLAGDLSHVRVVSMPQPLPVVHDCRDALRCCCWLASPACGLGSRATNALRKCPGLA